MEGRIIKNNRNHFKKAHSSKIYNQSIYESLPNKVMREKMFSRNLDENDCGDEDVRKFLNLLQDKYCNRRTHHCSLTELE